MDELQQQLRATFLEEAVDTLETLERAFLAWENDRTNTQLIDQIFRSAHNLKGSSKAVGYAEIGAFTHDLESLMLKIKNQDIPVSQQVFDLLLLCNDELGRMVLGQRGGDEVATDLDLAERLKAAINGQLANPSSVAEVGYEIFADSVAPVGTEHAAAAPMLHPPVDQTLPPPTANLVKVQVEVAAAKKAVSSVVDDSIRVSLERVDSLVTMIGELVILQTVLSQQRHQIESPLLQKTVVQLAKITKEIQDNSMSLRMMPLRQTFQKMQRIVRDTAKSLDKDIELELNGEDTELDKTVVDLLGDPLVHLIRNASDHGIETPSERAAAGKSPKGRIRLSAGHEGGKIMLEISDDGKGLNSTVLRQKAVEKGLIRADQSLTQEECQNLIFVAGFSTKASASDISGRGVGMDVVKTNVESVLKGEIQMVTELGKGTTFRIYLPLTLAIIDGLVVRSGSERYVIPLTQVHESIRARREDVHNVVGLGAILSLRGEQIPMHSLATQLGQRGLKNQTPDETAMIIRDKGQPFAITVDEILSRQQVVIKRLGSEVRQSRGVTGGAVLGDGTAALILDLKELVKREKRSKGAA
ncbi:MAG: chemotaxis protein CheA [Proteobacteria bacterium]|nr:chemotaxis protein CheA [Pseudomonadota bacterium]